METTQYCLHESFEGRRSPAYFKRNRIGSVRRVHFNLPISKSQIKGREPEGPRMTSHLFTSLCGLSNEYMSSSRNVILVLLAQCLSNVLQCPSYHLLKTNSHFVRATTSNLIPLLDIGNISFRASGNSLICFVGALCNSCIMPSIVSHE